MSESTLMDYLNKCQHLQRESKECDMVIDYSYEYDCFVVTMKKHGDTRYYRFVFKGCYTDFEAEQDYKELHNFYKQLERYEQ